MVSKRGKKQKRPSLIGRGFDHKPDEKRVTIADEFIVVGGSKENHERLQEEGIKMGEEARKRGKTLDQLSPAEMRDVMVKVVIEKR